jgi:hypothetical protein
MLDLVGPYGGPLLKSFLAFNAAHWIFARALNQIVSGSMHPESGFAIKSPDGKKEYTVRTTLGDFLHFIKDPRDFLYNRVNPSLVRVPVEMLSGVNQQGRKMTEDAKLMDAAKQFVPIPFQSLFPSQQVALPDAKEAIGRSLGIQTTNYLSPATVYALDQLSEKGEQGMLQGDELKAHQKAFKLEDDLRNAVQAKDPAATAKATLALRKAAEGPTASISVAQYRRALKNAGDTRLMSAAEQLPLEVAIDVYHHASVSEKKQLAQVIGKKVQNWSKSVNAGNKTPAQIERERQMIRQWEAEVRTQ